MCSVGVKIVFSLAFLISLSAPTHGVDVDLHYYSGHIVRCIGIRPGVCCRAPGPDYPTYVVVHNLLVNHIGVLWTARDGLGDCAGTPIRTQPGPGDFRSLHHTGYSGVSYIRLPKTTLRPDGTTSAWLEAEGLLGLVTGYGHWFSSRVKPGALPGATRKSRRGIIAGHRGTVYSGPPRWWKYPDLVTVNGTDYHSMNTSELNYSSADGLVLNAAELAL